MKRKLRYQTYNETVEQEISYIPLRYIIAILITVAEIAAIMGIMIALCLYVPYFYLLCWATEIACVVRIIASDDNPDYKVPWLLFVLIIPLAGFMLYFLFYSRTLSRKYLRRMQNIRQDFPVADDADAFTRLRQENVNAANQAHMICQIADTHLCTDTAQTYFPLGEDMHPRMLEDLRSAQHFIFVEYFIIEEGQFWNSILDILRDKAAQGVDVRVVFDDIGCMMTLPGNYAKILERWGIRAVPFSRIRGNADSEFNNRSHRKLLIIDGRVGYTGGVNIADEYINAVQRFGHWKDTGVRLEGAAVREMTKLFLLDFGTNYPKALPAPEDLCPACSIPGAPGYLIPFGDGPRPVYQRRVGKSVIQAMLAGAQRYVWMTSPYLIIDNDLCQCIENTALRGVEVKIIVPHIPDKKLILSMTRSFYPRLQAAGVEIYEYEPGFIHAKSYLVDDCIGMIGTINLDYRSLVHHFENGVWFYGGDALPALKRDIEDTLTRCIRISGSEKTSLQERVIRSLVRIVAPML